MLQQPERLRWPRDDSDRQGVGGVFSVVVPVVVVADAAAAVAAAAVF